MSSLGSLEIYSPCFMVKNQKLGEVKCLSVLVRISQAHATATNNTEKKATRENMT